MSDRRQADQAGLEAIRDEAERRALEILRGRPSMLESLTPEQLAAMAAFDQDVGVYVGVPKETARRRSPKG